MQKEYSASNSIDLPCIYDYQHLLETFAVCLSSSLSLPLIRGKLTGTYGLLLAYDNTGISYLYLNFKSININFVGLENIKSKYLI